MLPTTSFGQFHRSTVIGINNQIAIICFSDTMMDILTRISNIQFDGTFFAVPIQFYQLWTLFVAFDNHTLPAIFCLMTGKEGQLYTAVLDRISSLIPQFQPKLCMSDWEPAPRNSMKEEYPNVKIYGCWFHFTQCIWTKTQKLGLVKSFREHQQLATYIRHLMAIPFLPACHILSTFTFLESPTTLPAAEEIKLEKLKKYFRKRWIGHICPEELSIFDAPVSTNNGAEIFHSKLKRRVKCGHPRVWNFMNILNEIIIDTDNEIGRLCSGKEISRTRKRMNILNAERRTACELKLTTGSYNPREYLEAISHTIGRVTTVNHTDYSDESNESDEENIVTDNQNSCVVCLTIRTTIWIFLPCRHANCCAECAKRIEELGDPCPICRTQIETSFQIFTN